MAIRVKMSAVQRPFIRYTTLVGCGYIQPETVLQLRGGEGGLLLQETFDTDLLRQPADFRQKAIVHELLHLKYPNHGKLFRALERAYLSQGCGRAKRQNPKTPP